MTHPRCVTAFGACMVLTGLVHAGPLADPTRPPAGLAAPAGLVPNGTPHRANVDTARAIAAAARVASPPPPAVLPVLQAVQLPARGVALAWVDGKPLKVGDVLDGRSVLAIDSQGVLLRGASAGAAPERLWLLTGSPKQAAGSVRDNRSAAYRSAEPGTHTGTNTGTNTGTDASAGRSNDNPNAQTGTPAPVSLAGRTAP